MIAVSGILGFIGGALARATCELLRYAAWSGLESEVEAWKRSPRGRVHGYLDGLSEYPPYEGIDS